MIDLFIKKCYYIVLYCCHMVGGKKYIRWCVIFLLLLGAFFGLRWFKHKTDFMYRIAITDSMSPTLEIGDRTWTNPWETPEEGDIIHFKCFSPDRCGSNLFDQKYSGNFGGNTVMHRWVSTDPDGCMHIIGDNPSYDWDREFCLYPEDIKIEGVVHKLSF